MKEIIDLYSKMLIATLGFVAPAMTLLLGVVAEGLTKQRKRNIEIIKQTETIILTEATQTGGQNQERIDFIKKSIKQHERQKKKAEKDKNLLTPKRQVIRVFTSLITSIVFVICYYFLKTHFFVRDFFYCKLLFLSLSLCSFLYTIFCLWQIFCTITELKQIIALEKEAAEEQINIEQEN